MGHVVGRYGLEPFAIQAREPPLSSRRRPAWNSFTAQYAFFFLGVHWLPPAVCFRGIAHRLHRFLLFLLRAGQVVRIQKRCAQIGLFRGGLHARLLFGSAGTAIVVGTRLCPRLAPVGASLCCCTPMPREVVAGAVFYTNPRGMWAGSFIHRRREPSMVVRYGRAPRCASTNGTREYGRINQSWCAVGRGTTFGLNMLARTMLRSLFTGRLRADPVVWKKRNRSGFCRSSFSPVELCDF